jgi:hypothetical protein
MSKDSQIPASAGPDLGQGRAKRSRRGAWTSLKRGIALTVSGSLAALVLTAVLPPLVADQSDRAVVNAPVTLLTAPIDGEVTSMTAMPGTLLNSRSSVAEIVNSRVDRSTLITLEGKQTDTADNLLAIRSKRSSDELYVNALTDQIAKQTAIIEARYEQQILELKAQVGAAAAAEEEKKGVLGHQASLVARDVAGPEMVRAATQQLAGAQYQKQSAESKLAQKQDQLDSARNGIFVGDDVHDLAAMIQKKRDMVLDIQRLAIEQTQVASALKDHVILLDAERLRLASLQKSSVQAPSAGEVINVGASAGRHVSAGDTLARMVDCRAAFVVAIFSYRQGTNLAPGARVTIDAGPGGLTSGTVMEVLPRTSDKVDETYAVPFPQTERRELYVLVKPEHELRRFTAGGEEQCDIGRWVTITDANGWMPSASVVWRSAETGLTHAAQVMWHAIPAAWASVDQALFVRADAAPEARQVLRGRQ